MRYEIVLRFTGKAPRPDRPASCIRCGCTYARACAEGCHWVDDENLLCSVCLNDLFEHAPAMGYCVRKVHDEQGELLTISARVRRGAAKS